MPENKFKTDFINSKSTTELFPSNTEYSFLDRLIFRGAIAGLNEKI